MHVQAWDFDDQKLLHFTLVELGTSLFQNSCTGDGKALVGSAHLMPDFAIVMFSLRLYAGSGGDTTATWQSDTGSFLWQSFSQTFSDFMGYVYIFVTLRRLESALEAKSTGNEAQYFKSMKRVILNV